MSHELRTVRLIYYSHRCTTTTDEDLARILRTSIRRNERDHICGLLAFDQTWFMQVLEGPREAINNLYRDLILDDRHRDLRLITYEEIDSPRFANWSMALAQPGMLPGNYLERTYGGFNPPAFPPEVALEFMEILASYISEQDNR